MEHNPVGAELEKTLQAELKRLVQIAASNPEPDEAVYDRLRAILEELHALRHPPTEK